MYTSSWTAGLLASIAWTTPSQCAMLWSRRSLTVRYPHETAFFSLTICLLWYAFNFFIENSRLQHIQYVYNGILCTLVHSRKYIILYFYFRAVSLFNCIFYVPTDLKTLISTPPRCRRAPVSWIPMKFFGCASPSGTRQRSSCGRTYSTTWATSRTLFRSAAVPPQRWRLLASTCRSYLSRSWSISDGSPLLKKVHHSCGISNKVLFLETSVCCIIWAILYSCYIVLVKY